MILMGLIIGCLMPAAVDGPIDEFLASLASDEGVGADVRALVLKNWSECPDCDGAAFLVEALTLVSPRFREGLEAFDAQEFATAARIMGESSGDANPFVATYAAYYRAKALVERDDIVEARKTVDALLSDAGKRVARYTYVKAEVDFLRVYCLVQDLQFAAAERELTAFIDRHPNAPQRLIVAAKQLLAELRDRQAGRIGEVSDLMLYAARRLEHGDAGELVRQRQEKAIELLDTLIKEAEQQEQDASNAGAGGGGGGGRSGPSPGAPMPRSELPPGSAPPGALNASRRANPGEMWGAMPPAERERILQALQDRFPRRYRRLVEQYFEQLAKEP